MFAKNLEAVLRRLLNGADFSAVQADDLARRFESLRGSAMLPRGREQRAARLTPEQISSAVLGLASQQPGWAALASGALARLRPIGGPDQAGFREASLHALVARLITDAAARESLVQLRFSVSETSANLHGAAVAVFGPPEERTRCSYVSALAVSTLDGPQNIHDEERRFAPAARDLVLGRSFFAELARAIEWSAALPEPEGDGAEYDAEDAHHARMARLEIGPGARLLNVAVETQATWPRKETLITFDGIRLILTPPTQTTTTSVHVDLHGNQISAEEAQTVIQRFLSVLAWEDDQFAVLGHGWSGNPVPVGVPKANMVFATADGWLPPRRSPGADSANRALAHYRAGLNAAHAGLVTYAVLSFYKVLEVRFTDTKKLARWLTSALDEVRAQTKDDELWGRFDAQRGDEEPEIYVRKYYRHAAAHASIGHPSDEDDNAELSRLSTGARVLRLLARKLIAEELDIDALLKATSVAEVTSTPDGDPAPAHGPAG